MKCINCTSTEFEDETESEGIDTIVKRVTCEGCGWTYEVVYVANEVSVGRGEQLDAAQIDTFFSE